MENVTAIRCEDVSLISTTSERFLRYVGSKGVLIVTPRADKPGTALGFFVTGKDIQIQFSQINYVIRTDKIKLITNNSVYEFLPGK